MTRNRWMLWSLIAISAGVLLWGMFSPTPHTGFFGESDKVDHVLAFAVVSFLGIIPVRKVWVWMYWFTWLFLAFVLEYLQGYFLVKRTFDVDDVYANFMGVIVAFFVWVLMINMKRNNVSD